MGDDSNWAEDYNRKTDEKMSGTYTEDRNSAVSSRSASHEGTVSDTGLNDFDLNEALETIGSEDAQPDYNELNNVIKKSGGLGGYTPGAAPENYVESEDSSEGTNTFEDIDEALSDNDTLTF